MMKRVIKNNYKFIFGLIIGLIISITSVYAIEAYIESNKVSYNNYNKTNVEEAIDELYEKSGINKEKWTDPILNGADPVLKDPLIPIEIKNNGDVYYANENSEWYNYSEKRWANAVILTDTASKYSVGQHILEKDIESYFVWIPRYQYKIWNLANTEEYTKAIDTSTLTNKNYSTSPIHIVSNARIIDIKFGTVNDIPKMAEPTKTGVYYTHPAFTLGNKNLNGIWVGKFETGGTIDSPVVKPGVVALQNKTVKEFFNAGKNFATGLDSHMMKNTEWGAAAYLSHSQYGIGNQVNINNASDNYTGYSAAPNTDQSTRYGTYAEHTDSETTQPWNTPVGYLASTTGNISGIYDMAGGSWEYVAAYRKSSTTTNKSGLSEEEITTQISAGYIDSYPADSGTTTYNKRILGDATGEMGPFYQYYDGDGSIRYHNSWYGDAVYFVDSTYPWFYRGGSYDDGGITGQFSSHRNTGVAVSARGFRMVLAIQ